MNEDELDREYDSAFLKIVQELHKVQADSIAMASQLQFMTDMVDLMAGDFPGAKKEIIEKYAVKVYEKQKSEK